MQRFLDPVPPEEFFQHDLCHCENKFAAVRHFMSFPVLLEQLRAPLLTGDQFKAVLRDDYVRHLDCGRGVYSLGNWFVCRHCHQWRRGLQSRGPMKEASAAVRLSWPLRKHRRFGMIGLLSEKKLDAIRWIRKELEIWGERMAGSNKSGMLYVPFYISPFEMYDDFLVCCGANAYDETGKCQVIGEQSFVKLFTNGRGSEYLSDIQFTTPATFKKCSECEACKTLLRDLRKRGVPFTDPAVQAVVLRRRLHVVDIRADRHHFASARESFRTCLDLPTAQHAAILGKWNDTLLISADKSSDVFHPERFQQTDVSTQLPQFKGLLYGIMDHTFCENVAIFSAASGVPRQVRANEGAKEKKKRKKQGLPEPEPRPRAKPEEAKWTTSISWKGLGWFSCMSFLFNLGFLKKVDQFSPRSCSSTLMQSVVFERFRDISTCKSMVAREHLLCFVWLHIGLPLVCLTR